jgi:mono/diheme cytochrome c family protein
MSARLAWCSKIGETLLLCLPALLAGCASRQPGSFETAVVQKVKQKITVGGRGVVNPLASTPENIAAGRRAFDSYCMVCHGLDGQNTGVPFADRMSPPVPVLTSPAIQRYSDGQLKWVIENGVFPSGMPASKGILSEDEIWQIVTFIRHLPAKGSVGEPAVYGGEPMEHGYLKADELSNSTGMPRRVVRSGDRVMRTSRRMPLRWCGG